MSKVAAMPPQPPAAQVVARLRELGATISTAESCTGGLLSAALTDVPGASDVFFGGFITYSNTAKNGMIRVPTRLINDYGAVSNQVARAMADGARSTARTSFAVATTGVAGPDGGTDRKPVGLVYVAVSSGSETFVKEHRFGDIGREAVREATVSAAIELLHRVLETEPET